MYCALMDGEHITNTIVKTYQNQNYHNERFAMRGSHDCDNGNKLTNNNVKCRKFA